MVQLASVKTKPSVGLSMAERATFTELSICASAAKAARGERPAAATAAAAGAAFTCWLGAGTKAGAHRKATAKSRAKLRARGARAIGPEV